MFSVGIKYSLHEVLSYGNNYCRPMLDPKSGDMRHIGTGQRSLRHQLDLASCEFHSESIY